MPTRHYGTRASQAERGPAIVWRSWSLVVVLGCCASASCGDDVGTSGAGDAASQSEADASLILPPPPAFDGSFAELLEPNACTLLVAAACDGSEDCPSGQLCCGTFDTEVFTYRSIECSPTCDGADQRLLCHPGDPCSDPTQVCRRSSILAFDFISVCTAPGMTIPGTGQALDDLIVCGEERCHAGRERCCLRGRAGALLATPLAPYCTPEGEPCECPASDAMPDASASDGAVDAASPPPDDDAGDADGG